VFLLKPSVHRRSVVKGGGRMRERPENYIVLSKH